jgi:hypothetical protein
VDQNGTITGIALGGVNIIATTADGDISATCLVQVVNRAPELAALEPQIVKEGQPLIFKVSGADPDGDALTYSATNLPVGASFEPVTQLFTWTPDYFQVGSYLIDFEVSDGSLTAGLFLAITVTNISAEELTALLIQQVTSLNLDKGIKNSLTVKLKAAQKLIQKGREYLAMGVLKAFELEVGALRGKKLTAAQADQLKKSAETIIAHLKEAVAAEASATAVVAE